MKLTVAVKLSPTLKQFDNLLETVEAFNKGVQLVADVAFEQRIANKVELHHQLYARLRSEFGLSAQMAVRAIGKAVEAYRRDKSKHCTFDPHGSMVFDERIMSFKGMTHVSLLTLSGRELIPMLFGAYQAGRLDRVKGQADLILRNGVFYLYVTIEMPDAPPADTSGGTLGVDLGIVNIAFDSEGNSYSGEQIRTLRRKSRKFRSGLQHQSMKQHSKSAYRHLKRYNQKVSRFTKWVNHNISRRIVETAAASRKAIALEDLKGIRERGSVMSRDMRFELGNWSFNQLQQFICYKAEQAGIPVVFVDPRNTSRMCPVCGHIDKANRKTQAKFLCVQCGRSAPADFNAALNIAARGAVTHPMDGAFAV
jgi:IS605 OrfB family transposase